jgi:hypothetical protein
MKKTQLIYSFVLLLLVSNVSRAVVEQSTSFISQDRLQSAIKYYQYTESTEAVKKIFDSSPFIQNPSTEAFGIDETGSDSPLRDRLGNADFVG